MLNPGTLVVRAMAEPRTYDKSVSLFTLTVERAKPKPEDAGDDYKTQYYPSMPIKVVATNEISMRALAKVGKGDVLTLDCGMGLSVDESYLVPVPLEEDGNPVTDEDGNQVWGINYMNSEEVEAYADDLDQMVKDKEIFRVQSLVCFNPWNIYVGERVSGWEDSGSSSKSSRSSSSPRRRRASAIRDDY